VFYLSDLHSFKFDICVRN